MIPRCEVITEYLHRWEPARSTSCFIEAAAESNIAELDLKESSLRTKDVELHAMVDPVELVDVLDSYR